MKHSHRAAQQDKNKTEQGKHLQGISEVEGGNKTSKR